MYEAFYGLTSRPFDITPDPAMLYLSVSHREGLTHLLYGVERKHGIIVLTGESGTGKTILINALANRVKEKFHITFLADSKISASDLYQYISGKFELNTKGKGEFLVEFEKLLRKNASLGSGFILIIDEAQHLSDDLLEEIRLLSNIETHTEKLIQIILSGTLQLKEKIDSNHQSHFRQRSGVIYQLQPLDADEIKQYIENRLCLCGASFPIFTDDAIDAIYRLSDGVPRVINSLCNLALLFGCAEKHYEVDQRFVREAALSLNVSDAPKRLPHRGSNGSHAVNTAVMQPPRDASGQPGDEPKQGNRKTKLVQMVGLALAAVLLAGLVIAGNISQDKGRVAAAITTLTQKLKGSAASVQPAVQNPRFPKHAPYPSAE